MKWFRMYGEFAFDPKVQMLSEVDQRRFVMLMCIRCNDVVTLQDDEVTFHLRISNEEWQTTKAVLLERNLIGADNMPTSWDKRQYKSDDINQRVKQHRHKEKQRCNVTVTPPEPETDSDTDTEAEKTRARRGLADEIIREEELPSPWQDYAELKNIPNEQIFTSWRKFKDVSIFPYSFARWQAWVDRERISRAA